MVAGIICRTAGRRLVGDTHQRHIVRRHRSHRAACGAPESAYDGHPKLILHASVVVVIVEFVFVIGAVQTSVAAELTAQIFP